MSTNESASSVDLNEQSSEPQAKRARREPTQLSEADNRSVTTAEVNTSSEATSDDNTDFLDDESSDDDVVVILHNKVNKDDIQVVPDVDNLDEDLMPGSDYFQYPDNSEEPYDLHLVHFRVMLVRRSFPSRSSSTEEEDSQDEEGNEGE